MTEIKVTDNSKVFKKAKDEAVERALIAIGMTAERHAKERCPVDTGRLRNSITYATQSYSGQGSYTDQTGTSYADAAAKAKPEDRTVYVGTNVEYARYVENGDSMHHVTGAAHFLRDAAAAHGDEYKKIAVAQLKSA